jgi:hypothetical protein
MHAFTMALWGSQNQFQRNESILGADSRATIFFKALSSVTLTLERIVASSDGLTPAFI